MNTTTIFALIAGGALIAFPFGVWFGCLYRNDVWEARHNAKYTVHPRLIQTLI